MPKKQKSSVKINEMVAAAYPQDMEQAHDFLDLLRASDIPAVIREREIGDIDDAAIKIMVPQSYIEEAAVIIESIESYDDFYGIDFDDDDQMDFDSFMFENEY